MKRGMGWPIGIAVTLGLLVTVYVRLAIIAGTPHSLVVEEDYYERAVHWDDAMRQSQLNNQLGWHLQASLGHVAPGADTDLRVELTDAAGVPLAGASVQVTAIHNAIANTPVVGSLHERKPGSYEAALDVHRTGQWELRFVVTREGQRFTADLRTDALPLVTTS